MAVLRPLNDMHWPSKWAAPSLTSHTSPWALAPSPQIPPKHLQRREHSQTCSLGAHHPGTQSQSANGAEEENTLFREAMAGVEALQSNRVRARDPGPLSKPSRRPLLEGELEAYAQLVDLVSGGGSFDIEYTDEYIEGAVIGADPDLLTKLRRGDFSIQAHFDLHGMTTSEAREAVERFILSSVIKGLRCVLIIHGRGLNSRDQIPILKKRMSSWLKRGRLKQMVLAFATAQPCDGGAGALYVFLRKCQPAFSGHGSKD